VIGFDESQIGTRRWFYLIPREGEPVAILHVIEPNALRGAPGKSLLYRSWRELEEALRTHLEGMKRVAMEYSPGAAIPYVARVDGGTVEMVRAAGLRSSPPTWCSNELPTLTRRRSTTGLPRCLAAKDAGFVLIRERLASGAG
jgi:hypothetical protein